MCGDSNAHGTMWGYDENNNRGHDLEETLATFALECLNIGSVPTWRRGTSRSILDVAFASHFIHSQLFSWGVDDTFTSDHSSLTFSLKSPKRLPFRQLGKCDWLNYESRLKNDGNPSPKKWSIQQIDQEAIDLNKLILHTFAACTPLTKPRLHKHANKW